MPYAYGVRLGVNRYETEFIEKLELPTIDVQNKAISWPKIPNSYPVGYSGELPSHTLETRFHPEGHVIRWSLHPEDTDSSVTIDGKNLDIGSNEGEEFRLVAESNGEEKTFACTIQYLPTKEFVKPTFNLDWANANGEINLSFVGEIQYLYTVRFGRANLFVNNNEMKLNAKDFKFVSANKQFNIPASLRLNYQIGFDLLCHDEPTTLRFVGMFETDGKVSVYSFEYELHLDDLIEKLNVRDNLNINVSFDPLIVSLEELFSTGQNSLQCAISCNAGELEKHVSWNIVTDFKEKIASGTIEHKQDLPRDKLQSLLLNGEIQEFTLSVTPVVTGVHLDEFTEEAILSIDKPISPLLGFKGDKQESWIQFLVNHLGENASQKDRDGFMEKLQISLTDDQLTETDHLHPQLDGIIKRLRYRNQSARRDEKLESNSAEFTNRLHELFKYSDASKPYLHKEKVEKKLTNQVLSEIYGCGGHSENSESSELIQLKPRQQLEIKYEYPWRSAEDVERYSVAQSGARFETLTDDGTRLTGDEGTDEQCLRRSFGYKKNNEKYTAPGIPGVYFLIEKGADRIYIFEIEVIGYGHGESDD